AGVQFNWSGFYKDEQRKRVPLPPYPFENQRYWIDARSQINGVAADSKAHKRANVTEWFYTPSWKRTPLPHNSIGNDSISSADARPWLLFCDQYGIGTRLAGQLHSRGFEVFTVAEGAQFERNDHAFTIRSQAAEDYQSVLKALTDSGKFPDKIIHLGKLADARENTAGLNDSPNVSF